MQQLETTELKGKLRTDGGIRSFQHHYNCPQSLHPQVPPAKIQGDPPHPELHSFPWVLFPHQPAALRTKFPVESEMGRRVSCKGPKTYFSTLSPYQETITEELPALEPSISHPGVSIPVQEDGNSKGRFYNRLKGTFAESIPSKQAGVFYPTHQTYLFRQLQEPEEPKHLYGEVNFHAQRGKSKKIIAFNPNLRFTKLETSKVIKIFIFYIMS